MDDDFYAKLRKLSEDAGPIRILSGFREGPIYLKTNYLSAHTHENCPVCDLVGPSTGRVSSKDPQPTMTVLKARQPGMRTLAMAFDQSKRKFHKKRSNQTDAYHRRIQKKWDKQWRKSVGYPGKLVWLSLPGSLSQSLSYLQSVGRADRKPKHVIIKEVTSDDIHTGRVVLKKDSGQLQESQKPAQDTTGLPGSV